MSPCKITSGNFRHRRRSLVTLMAGVACTAFSGSSNALPRNLPTINDYGGVGLMQTRTARFMESGGASIGGSDVFPHRRYWGTFQPFSWLETTFRFADILNEAGATDRSFDAKMRLLKENQYWPQIAVGFQDLAGTGIFSSEYVVASRRVYDFDFTFGIAWGRLGSEGTFRNPLTYLAESFESRTKGKSTGGTPGVNSYFRGRDVGLFGGIEYATPVNGLRVLVEYDGDTYLRERKDPNVKKKTPINFGVSYQPTDWMDISLGYERGDEVMVRGTLLANFNSAKPAPKFDKLPERIAFRQPLKVKETLGPKGDGVSAQQAEPVVPENLYQQAAYQSDDAFSETGQGDVDVDMMFDVLADYGYQVDDFHFDGRNVTVEVSIIGIAWRADTVPLAVRVLARLVTLPAGTITLSVNTPEGGKFRTTINRTPKRLPETRFANQIPVSNALPLLKSSVAVTPSGASRLPLFQAVSLAPPLELDFKLRQSVAERLIAGLGQSGLIVDGVSVNPQEVTVFLRNKRYFIRAQGLGRAARIIANRLPPSVEVITLVSLERGLEVSRVSILRKDLEVSAQLTKSVGEIWHSARIEGPDPAASAAEFRPVGLYPDFGYTIKPKMRQSVFDPQRPFLYQLYMAFGVRAQLTPGLSLRGGIGVNVYQNFTDSNRGAGSNLPHVRSDILRYLQDGKNNLENLQVDYMRNLGKNLYGRVSVGFFEQMYGGVSGEVLYAAYGQRWTIGADLNQVWKRNFNQRIGFQDYDVLTGHISLNYELPWPRMLTTIRAGRYLAKDIGATFEVTRIFDSGVRLGGFFTLTDVSAAEFGEGSFDKGITLSLPLDLFLSNHSRRVSGTTLRPLFRDGGQMVNINTRLYPMIAKYSEGALELGWNRFLD